MYCTVTYTFTSYFSSGYKEHESMFCMKLYVYLHVLHVYSYTGTSYNGCLHACNHGRKFV